MAYLDYDGLSYFWSKFKGKLGALAWKSTVAKSDLAQAVQTAHNGDTVVDAQGWPKA